MSRSFSIPGLLLNNLAHFRRANLAVIAGVAVATAVLTGALMVGDSVRASLRDLAIARLGPVDYAMTGSRFVGEDLAARLKSTPQFKSRFSDCWGALQVKGAASTEAGARSTGVQILGGDQFFLWTKGVNVVNSAVWRDLELKQPNTSILLNLPLVSQTPRDAPLAPRGRTDSTSGLRINVDHVDSTNDFLSSFSLTGGQRLPKNIWINLKELQNAIDQPGRINMLLVSGGSLATADADTAQLNQLLAQSARLADYDLSLKPAASANTLLLNSTSTYILDPIQRAAQQAAEATNSKAQRISVYLINHTTRLDAAGDTKSILHYAIAAAVENHPDLPLKDNEIALNEWAANKISAKLGDRLRFEYYLRQSGGELAEVKSEQTFTIAKILPMSGIGADRSLVPAYKGLTDKATVDQWDPPAGMVIDKKLADDAYWKLHRMAPQIFVSLPAAKKLWGNALGDVSSIRIEGANSMRFEEELLKRIKPEELGLAFIPIKAQQLAASEGATDFSGLFIGFSFFIIASAAMLVAMLFRLNIEQRSRQMGLMGAVGFSPKLLRRMAMAEGMSLALIGSIIGGALGVGYTALMMWGLRTWWVGAVGTTALRLHVTAMTLCIGIAASLAVAAVAIGIAVWRLGKTDAVALLSGNWRTKHRRSAGRPTRILTALFMTSAITLLAMGFSNKIPAQAAFMGAGAMLLAGGFCAMSLLLGARRGHARLSLTGLGIRNASRNRARSLLTVSLIAFASFVLVAVGAFKQSAPDSDNSPGGYSLILQSDVPLLGDLNTPSGRRLLGVQNPNDPLWNDARFVSMRAWAGQDISCLNLTRPTSPTILAVPPALAQNTEMEFAGQVTSAKNPWDLLSTPGDEIPIIADNETASYILKLGLGESFPITDQLGRPRKLKLVATLSHSIFQGELLMSEENFIKLFPSQGGFSTVLIESPPGRSAALRKMLSNELEDFAVNIEPTSDRLARYQEVANTYISTFQALGSLGLLLGTIGLAVVLLRGLVERKAEIALLAALGFSPARRSRLILAENGLLLLAGLLLGAICAGIGIWPALATTSKSINPAVTGATLAGILLCGMLVLWIAVRSGLRTMTPADLRGD